MRDLRNAYVLAAFLTATGTPCTPGALRQWARRGHITRAGTGRRGLALYDPGEVERHARQAAACTAPAAVSH